MPQSWHDERLKQWKGRRQLIRLDTRDTGEKAITTAIVFHREVNCNPYKRINNQDKHGWLFLFCLVVVPRAPCQSTSLELLSAVIDIFKTAALETGMLANTGSRFCNFQYLVMRCFLCIGYFTLTAATSTTMDLVNMVKLIIQHEGWFSIKYIPNSFLFIRRINHGQVLE